MKKFILVTILVLFLANLCHAANLPVTSKFGWRIHPIYGTWKFHRGVDLGYATGTPVPAMLNGVIYTAGNLNDGYGLQVVLYSPENDVFLRFAHLSRVYVYRGQHVAYNDTIGLVGATGNVTGPHLHLEYIGRDSSGQYQYFDPLETIYR